MMMMIDDDTDKAMWGSTWGVQLCGYHYDKPTEIYYSTKYTDGEQEYRHVGLPEDLTNLCPSHLMSEEEWRELGVQMSKGWNHCTVRDFKFGDSEVGFEPFEPEPHILFFKRTLTDQRSPAQ